MKAVKKKKTFTRGSVRVFFSYYTPHRKLLLLDLVMAVFAVAAELVFPYATRYALNRLLPNGLYKAFFLLMAGLLGAYLLRALAQYIVTVYGHELGVRVEADMREDIFAKVQTLSFAFFDKHRTGKLMSRMTTDLFRHHRACPPRPGDRDPGLAHDRRGDRHPATIRWELALILFLLLPVLLAVVMRLRLRLRARSLDVKRETAEINTAVEAGVSGIRTVKAFANEQDAMDKFRTSNEKFKKVKKKLLPHFRRVQRLDRVCHGAHAARNARRRRCVHYAGQNGRSRSHHVFAVRFGVHGADPEAHAVR